MRPLPTTRLTVLLAELRELPDGLETPVTAGLLVADVLRALGWSAGVITAETGVDLVGVESAAIEALS